MCKYNFQVDALTDRRLTYGELRHAVLHLSGLLCRQGLLKNELVLMACQTTVDFPVVFLAFNYIGVTVCTISPQAKKGVSGILLVYCSRYVIKQYKMFAHLSIDI